MRYSEKKPVREVLEWLGQQGVVTRRDAFQKFLRRVLNLMPDAKVKELRVDLDFLRAVRRRLNLPLAPSTVRAPRVKAMPPFYARSRHRRIAPLKKTRPVREPLARPPEQVRFEADRLPLAGTVAATAAKEDPLARLRGTPDAPQGYGDWKIINGIARKKVFRKDRQMMLNMQGTVLHLETREEYTPERLRADFGLTATEAESCFMTFTA